MAALTLTMHRDFNHNQLLAQLVVDREQVTLDSLETETNAGFKSLMFSVKLSNAAKDLWLDDASPWWMCDLRLTAGSFLVFEGQLAEIVEADDGVSCTAVGYWNALFDDYTSEIHNRITLSILYYGYTVQAVWLYVVNYLILPAGRLQVGDIPGPSSAFSTIPMTEPAKFGDYLIQALDLSVEDRNILYHWYYYVWDNRKVYTAEFAPSSPPAWRVRRKPGTRIERRLTLDGYATTSYVDYGPSRVLSDEHTDLVEQRRLGYQRVNYRRESTLISGAVANILAKKELQTRSSPARLGNITVQGDMEDMAGVSWPGYHVRAGQSIRVLEWTLPRTVQRDLVIFHTVFDFKSNQLTLTVNDAPARLSLSKGGVIYST